MHSSITSTEDTRAQEQAAAAPGEGLGLYDDDAYYEDAYYDEVVYGYDEANPCNDAQVVPRSSNAVPVPIPTLRRIQCTDAPMRTPVQAMDTAEGAALTEGDLALQHLRSLLPTPGEQAALQAEP